MKNQDNEAAQKYSKKSLENILKDMKMCDINDKTIQDCGSEKTK